MRNSYIVAAACAASLVATAQSVQHPSDTPWADYVCFAEGTPQDYMNQRTQAISSLPPGAIGFNIFNRWPGSQGSPTTVTWSFVPDGTNIPNGVGEGSGPSQLFSDLDGAYASQGGRAAWIQRFQQSFDRWEELTGLTFVRRTSGGNDWDDGASWFASGNAVRGDIRIGAKSIDGGGGILAYAGFPDNGNMVFDIGDNWGSASSQNRFFRNTIMHEMGHSIGFSHVCSSNGVYLMEPFLQTSIDGPYHDDIRAGQRNYGDPFEPDNNLGSATDLGVLTGLTDVGALPAPVAGVDPPNSSLLSLDDNGEQDWFVFDVADNSMVRVTVDPLGVNYDDSDQGGGGCGSGNFIDSSRIGNPELTLFEDDGTTVVALSTSGGEGQNEEVNVTLTPGTYAIRVFNNDPTNSIQLYDLEIEVDPLASCAAPASVFNRNNGSNLATYVASPPVLGGTLSLGVVGSYSNAVMLAYNQPLDVVLGNGQALLIDIGASFLFSKAFTGLPFGTATQPVPTDASICGLTAYTQVVMTGPTAGGPSFQLTNAQDITVGN